MILLRHPAVSFSYADHRPEHKCYGQTDIGLSYSFDYTPTAEAVRNAKPERIISSDLLRCRLLAEQIAGVLSIKVHVDRRWRELNFGTWENRTWIEIRDSDPREFEHWVRNFVQCSPPGGESFVELQLRTNQAMKECAAFDQVLVVTHAGPIRAALCAALGLPLARAFELSIPFAAPWFFTYQNDRWLLISPQCPNSAAWLEGAP